MPEMKARTIGIPIMFGLLMTQAIPGMISRWCFRSC
jgi:hypothetical protein